MKRGHLVLLVVEDDENDVLLFQIATRRSGSRHAIHSVPSAAEAIRYLRGEGEFADRVKFPVPNVILADLNMPEMNGFDFLKWLRQHPECTIIPTIIFSSSAMESDIRMAYRLGANSFLSKPSTIDSMVELLRSLFDYWSRCECPPMGPAEPTQVAESEHPARAPR